MGTVVTVRLDAETDRLVRRLAKRAKVSRSEIIRMALHRFTEDEHGHGLTEGSVLERVADLIGSHHSGHGRLSEQTGRRVRALLGSRKTA